MDKRVFFESMKAFSVGAIFGLIIMYFGNSENFSTPFIFGIISLGFHARNNSYKKIDQK